MGKWINKTHIDIDYKYENEPDYLYDVNIYINGSFAPCAIEIFSNLFSATAYKYGILKPCNNITFHVTKNDTQINQLSAEEKKSPDNWLYYPCVLEMFGNKNLTTVNFISKLNQTLKVLWYANYDAVASCDYTEELTHDGGITKEKKHILKELDHAVYKHDNYFGM